MGIILFLILLSITNISQISSQCLEDQKSLLVGLKSNLIFYSPGSTKLVKWNHSTDCCSWNGVECDAAGHVISLQLDEESISGGIEDSEYLFRLTYLKKLNLAHNNFGRTEIPKGIHNLTELTHLNLSDARFAGQVPLEILGLRKLQSLDLSSSYTDESMKLKNPDLKMLVQNLTGLRQLYLDLIDISSQGSDWCQVISSSLPDLRILSLRNCDLSGPIDSSLARLRSLSVLRLDGNSLSSSVPNSFANFSKLKTLSLSGCSLHGFFPQKVFQIPSLQNIDLSSNDFLSGTLPQFPLNGSLRNILLSLTNFSGSLPASIGNLAMLSTLDLHNCRFNGPLPPTIGKLTELDHFDISANNFSGSIPLFHLSKKLTHINAARNSLTGSLSSMHFQGLLNLAFLDLDNNLLGGNIPSNLFALPFLQSLDLSNNKFDGPIQEVSILSSSLDMIDLRYNHLEGPIPKFFSQLDVLTTLLLSSNFFNGTVQLEMFPPSLFSLDLSFNNLSIVSVDSNSSLPLLPQIKDLGLSSCKLKKFPQLYKGSTLTYLDLSSNQLKGQIPNWIWEIGNGSLKQVNLSFNMLDDFQKPYKFPPYLNILDLHSNQLHGELPIPPPDFVYVDFSFNYFSNSIPNDIGNLIYGAIFFSVSNNKLTGEIPTSICNAAPILQILDLSRNALNGSIPSCLPNMNFQLGVLSLASNNLSGDIPDTFADKCSLKTLDLENNVLTGKIPGSLVNCSFLEVLNIGNNRIEDTFPCMLTKMGLRVLILRSNRFHGELLCCFATTQEWPNLQIIDISHNNFSGDISVLNFSNWGGMISANNNNDLIRFDSSFLDGLHYQDTVTVTMKGLEIKLTKILTIFTSIDFSSNKFYGEIPSSIGDLKSLYLLTLSHNAIMGSIPASIGNLKQLGSLDLSLNNLTGNIPVELASLGFISFLNLSFNDLFGKIPKGPQLQTFTEASYEGNAGLCGFPVNKSCNDDGVSGASPPEFRNESEKEIGWGYVSTALGFVVGLSSFLWLLLHCKSWGDVYFEKVDLILETLFPHKHGTRNHRRRVIRNRG